MAERKNDGAPLFAVDEYCDRLSVQKKKRFYMDGTEWHHYFNTEDEAKAFIIQRASADIAVAEDALIKAKRRYQRCLKKYGSAK